MSSPSTCTERRRGAPGRWLVALILAWLGLVVGGLAEAQTLESVLAPGEVIKGHAKVEHDCKSCHQPFKRAVQDQLCIDCHKDVGEDIRHHKGFHGKRDKQPTCRSCHLEHRGRNAQPAAFDHASFDHRQTEFDLHDKHRGLDCEKCHAAGKRWREAATTCVGCHRKDDPHKAGLGPKCESCHFERGWKEVNFDHDKQTRFALIDKHIGVKCDDCHANGRFKDTPRECVACHRKDDHHKGHFGDKCESCHDVKSWKGIDFDHDRDTTYVLKAKHRSVKCESCHTGTASIYDHKLGTDCVDCHLGDDKHKGDLGKRCETCHSERGWKEAPGFDHAKSDFPLLGSHADVACEKCHLDQQYRQTPTTCIACHKKDDKHQGNLGERCTDCHDEHKWKTTVHFDHDHTKFPLRNAHADTRVKCADCHETLRAMRGLSTDCVSCHRRDDKHETTLGSRCDTCHNDHDWHVQRFDHSRTAYPLLGSHAVVACKSCHLSQRYKEAAKDCISCHRKDDDKKHKGTLGPACESCHNVRAWSLWDFDHDKRSHFALEGRHRKVDCAACHDKPAPAGKPIAPVASDCLACHRKDDVHEGRFGRRCESCHSAEDWRRVRKATDGR